MPFFAFGHGLSGRRRSNREQPSSTQKPQVERFNRLLDYLFPTKSYDDRSSRPTTPANQAAQAQAQATRPQVLRRAYNPQVGPSQQQRPVIRRPHTAPAAPGADMYIPHSHHHHNSDSSTSTTTIPLDIILHDSPIILRGTGVDIENGILRGTVRLSLAEDTDIKVVEIRMTGKSKVSVTLKDGGTRSQPQTHLFYAHSLDLLEGAKSHPHTLKAGLHEFPFTFEIDAAKAATSLTANFGMAIVDWKLRALALRPSSFATNWSATREVMVVRSFGNEALEFQQTLEIENVWPEKLNYAVILPHKAWAAGDTISAILKFTPLTKGVKVVSVKMSLQEKVKTVWKALTHEDIRVVCSKKEALRVDGRRRSSATTATPETPNTTIATPNNTTNTATPNTTAPTSPVSMAAVGEQDSRQREAGRGTPSFFRRVGSRVHSRENLLGLFRTRTGEDGILAPGDSVTPSSRSPPLPDSAQSHHVVATLAIASASANAGADADADAGTSSPRSLGEEGEATEEVEMVIRMQIPMDATPSHSVVPIIVSHRVKWDVLIANLDGHYSELRCSLPVHLLAKEVLEETLAATNATRTALLGESHGVPVQEIVLPAYHDHTRDRVAIAELHDHALATNPLNSTSIPTSPEDDVPADLPGPLSSSYGPSSTLADQMGRSNVPRVASMPDASDRGRMRRFLGLNGPADATSSELYLSLGRAPDTTLAEIGSHPASQSSSRASSPERSGEASTPHSSSGMRSSLHHFSIRPFTVFSKNKGTPPTGSGPGSGSTPPSSRPNSRTGTRNPSAWHRRPLSRSSSGPSTPSSPDGLFPLPLPGALPISRPSTSPPRTSSSALGEYYDAVPEYAIAARGFLGGGITPLSSFRGLPSYDQAQRSRTSSPQSSMQVANVTSTMSTSTSQGSSASSGSRRRGSFRGSRRASVAGERQSPSLPPLPPSPPSSSRPSSS